MKHWEEAYCSKGTQNDLLDPWYLREKLAKIFYLISHLSWPMIGTDLSLNKINILCNTNYNKLSIGTIYIHFYLSELYDYMILSLFSILIKKPDA